MTSTKQESVWEYPRQPRVEDWYCPEPVERYAEITNCVAFYSARVHACYVDPERVWLESKAYYGGWVTEEIAGL
jgi:hypothetical protein